MTVRLPPRLATWILLRFADARVCDCLAGDLLEEFANGRSPGWYWRQVAGALLTGFTHALRTHGLSFTAAVLAGCAFNSFWRTCFAQAFHPLYAQLLQLYGHGHTRHRLLLLAGLQLNTLSNTVLTCLTVWLVTRIHRAYRRAALVAFVAIVFLQNLPALLAMLKGVRAHPVSALEWAAVMVPIGLQISFPLAAGLWFISGRRFSKADPTTRRLVVGIALLGIGVAVIYHARLVGLLPLSGVLWYVLDAADILCVLYLAVRWWKPVEVPA